MNRARTAAREPQRWPARRASVSAAIACELVDAHLTTHARQVRDARRAEAAWWFCSGFTFGAAAIGAVMLLAAWAGVPLVP